LIWEEALSMKIVFYTRLNRLWLRRVEELKREFGHVDFVTETEMLEGDIEDAHAIVGGHIPPELIQRAGNLVVIFVPFAGIDALPLDQIKARGIRVSNSHGNAPYVAERAVAMALAFYGRIIDYHNDLRNSRWHGFFAKGGVRDSWDSIRAKTCAVLGTGEIGRYIAGYLKAFGCKIIGFKRRPEGKHPEHFDEITLDLNEALGKAELIFIGLPLTEETCGMFSAELLASLEGKFLVNVGRGEIVDEEGLYESLKRGILKGAAIDVWYTYPGDGEVEVHPSRFPIHELPNVILSPHIAGFTPQAAEQNIEQSIENIRSYLKTGSPLFEVDLELMY
jgi:phosphoglycerate dehydrogenase-like enzyme